MSAISRTIIGDCRAVLPTLEAGSVQCCVTSPPYWGLRDYGTATWEGGDIDCEHKRPPLGGHGEKSLIGKGTRDIEIMSNQQYRGECKKCGAVRIDTQIGLESTPAEYVAEMVAVFREVRRVLRDDGTVWLNLGDSYAGGGRGSGGAGPSSPKQRTNLGAYFDGNTDFDHGLKPKDLIGIPWRVAFALQADGWYLRQDIIWAKPNPMPESVRDRCTKSHEYLFLLAKSERYYYDADAIAEPGSAETAPRRLRADLRLKDGYSDAHFNNPPIRAKENNHGCEQIAAKVGNDNRVARESLRGELEGCAGDGGSNRERRSISDSDSVGTRNKRDVWTVATQPYSEAHFATFPPALIEPCILAGCPPGGLVLDPFGGSGTTGQVAEKLGRKWLLIELNAEYGKLCADRTQQIGMVLA